MQTVIKTDPNGIIRNTFYRIVKTGYVVVYVNVTGLNVDLIATRTGDEKNQIEFVFKDFNEPDEVSIVEVTFDDIKQKGVMYNNWEDDQISFIFVPKEDYLI